MPLDKVPHKIQQKVSGGKFSEAAKSQCSLTDFKKFRDNHERVLNRLLRNAFLKYTCRKPLRGFPAINRQLRHSRNNFDYRSTH